MGFKLPGLGSVGDLFGNSGGGGGGNSGFQQSGGVGGFFNKAQENVSASTTSNRTIGASEGGVAVELGGENATATFSDLGAITAAFDFATRQAQDSLGLVERSATNAQKTLEQTIALADDNQSGGAQRLLYFGAAALAAFAIYAYYARH